MSKLGPRGCDECASDRHSNCQDPQGCGCPCYCYNCGTGDSCWVCECNCRYCLGYTVDRGKDCKYYDILPT